MKYQLPLLIKRQVLKRDNYKCLECGSNKDLVIHHNQEKQKGINHNINNLSTLCSECHNKKRISNRTNKDRSIIVLNIAFEKVEYERLNRLKGFLTWKEFIMLLIDYEEDLEQEN